MAPPRIIHGWRKWREIVTTPKLIFYGALSCLDFNTCITDVIWLYLNMQLYKMTYPRTLEQAKTHPARSKKTKKSVKIELKISLKVIIPWTNFSYRVAELFGRSETDFTQFPDKLRIAARWQFDVDRTFPIAMSPNSHNQRRFVEIKFFNGTVQTNNWDGIYSRQWWTLFF